MPPPNTFPHCVGRRTGGGIAGRRAKAGATLVVGAATIASYLRSFEPGVAGVGTRDAVGNCAQPCLYQLKLALTLT